MRLFKDAQFQLKQKFGYTPLEEAIKLFDQAYHYKSTILPINLLDQISELSYQIEHYPQIINSIIRGLTVYMERSEDILKTLIITDYVLKYGCSACIDDLKVRVQMFRPLSQYKMESSHPLHESIRKKSQHIANQLTNRKLLYKEKEIAKQIKIKLQINKSRLQGIQGTHEKQDQSIDDLFENYIFKYLDRINDKLDDWGDKINQKLDNLIENINTQELTSDEYHFPESCMEEIQIVTRPIKPIQFDYIRPQAQINLGQELFDEPQSKQQQQQQQQQQIIKKEEVNLLE